MTEQYRDPALHDQPAGAPEEYTEQDLQYVLEQATFERWGYVAKWLEQHGANDPALTPGKVKRMIEDCNRLQQGNIYFTQNGHEAVKLIRQHIRR